MKKRPGLSSSSGGSRSHPPAADLDHSYGGSRHQEKNMGETTPSIKKRPGLFSSSSGGSRLAHSYYGGSRHQDPSEELMLITIKNHLPRPPRHRPSVRDRNFSLLRRKTMTVKLTTEVCQLSPSTTVGELMVHLQKRHRLPSPDFLLLQEHDDGYPRALFHKTATLADCHVTHGDTLHLSPSHTFPLRLYNNTPLKNRFIPNPATNHYDHGKFIHLQPSIYTTVAHLKEIIFGVTGYHPESQLLNPLTTRLHDKDNQTLQSLGFKSSNGYRQLALYNCPPLPPNHHLPPSTPKIHISVVDDMVGGRSNVSVDPNVTVKELRDKILLIGKTYRLSFGSAILEDDKTLSDYKITHGDIINLSDFC